MGNLNKTAITIKKLWNKDGDERTNRKFVYASFCSLLK